MDADNWINLASAIGTLAAVVVAIRLAATTSKRSDKDAMNRANLAAAGIVARLTSVGDTLHGLRASIAFSMAKSDDHTRVSILSKIRHAVQADLYRPDQDILFAMTPLPNLCAYRIASGYDYLDRLRISVSQLPSGLIMEGTTAIQRIQILENWAADIDKACDQFTVAIRECVKASHLAAPLPDGGLLFGNDPTIDYDHD